jgi:hypothetical protein
VLKSDSLSFHVRVSSALRPPPSWEEFLQTPDDRGEESGECMLGGAVILSARLALHRGLSLLSRAGHASDSPTAVTAAEIASSHTAL